MQNHKNSIQLGVCLLVMVIVILTGCSSTSEINNKPDEKSSNTILMSEYKIGIDDILQVSVWRNPELSIKVPVRPDGKISVPLAGDVQAGGLTSTEVAEAIRDKLAVYVRDPQVTVIVAELKSHEFLTRVRVTGAVRVPSSMPYRQGMTVLDAVLQSGGINEFAASDRTTLHRKKDSKIQVYSIRLDAILNKGQLETNYELQPGDIITVPERFF